MKNAVLLHRSGRDQYGNKGKAHIERSNSPDNELQKSKEEHVVKNNEFVLRYSNAWLKLLENKSRKEIWGILSRHGKPAFSTFSASIRQHDSLNDFLIYWLVASKPKAMKILGFTTEEIARERVHFENCGGCQVSFGKGKPFSTIGLSIW
jgi:hypothetical protein